MILAKQKKSLLKKQKLLSRIELLQVGIKESPNDQELCKLLPQLHEQVVCLVFDRNSGTFKDLYNYIDVITEYSYCLVELSM